MNFILISDTLSCFSVSKAFLSPTLQNRTEQNRTQTCFPTCLPCQSGCKTNIQPVTQESNLGVIQDASSSNGHQVLFIVSPKSPSFLTHQADSQCLSSHSYHFYLFYFRNFPSKLISLASILTTTTKYLLTSICM